MKTGRFSGWPAGAKSGVHFKAGGTIGAPTKHLKGMPPRVGNPYKIAKASVGRATGPKKVPAKGIY